MRCLMLLGLLCGALAFVPAADAATVSIDFESGPAIGTAINDDYKASAFTFWQRSDPGWRPYRRVAGVATHSGTVAADISQTHCFEESDESSACEFPVPGTQANITRTPTSITLYAGLFSAFGGPVNATLTAYKAGNMPVATSTVPIGLGITTPITVNSASPDIVAWSLTADQTGPELGFDDVTYTIPNNLVPEVNVIGPVNTVPVLQGNTTDVPVQVTRLNGSDGNLTFAVGGLPSGVTGTVTPDPLPGTQSNATMHLTAAADATTTFLQNATLTADPNNNANVAPAPRSAPFTVRVTSAYELRGATGAMQLPHCAPVERAFSLDRDRAFASTATLSLAGVPPGVSAQILPGTTIAPGGNFNVDRTLRVSRGTADVPDNSVITIRATAPGYPDKTLAVPIGNATPETTLAGPNVAGTARLLHPGTTVRLDGNGFCPGTEVRVGNFTAAADATVADDGKSLTFVTPRSATTGRVIVNPPNGANPYQTPTDLTVKSFRGEDGFAFKNYSFGSLSISELTEAFGADDLFLQINLCWPWGTCYVPTGILDPIAAIEWPVYSAILHYGDGHCYGMNRAIQEILGGKTSLNRWAYGARGPFELPNASGPQNGLNSYLDSRQALQLSSEALISRFDRDEHLSTQLGRIRTELEHGRYPGVVMMTGVGGHEITAYDIERGPDGSTRIMGYDNNRPLTDAELVDTLKHNSEETQASVITVNPAGDHWTFQTASGATVSGGGNDGKLYAVTLADIPDNPSLPGLSDLPLIVTDIIASVDGAATSGPAPDGGQSGPLTDQNDGTSATGEVVSAAKGAKQLSHTMEGVHKGTYSNLMVGNGFVGGVKDVATDKGVTDALTGTPGAGALKFAGERNRALDVNLAVDHGDVHRSASIATHAFKGGSDAVSLGKGASLSYAHTGATTRASFTLTNVARNGGPVTFSSGPMTVRRGERLKLTPVSWRALDRVRVTSSKGGSKILRNRTGFAASFRLGTLKVAKGVASVATSIRRLPPQTAGGVVLRLQRGGKTVARKAIAITAPKRGGHTYAFRLPKSLKRGTYKLVANMVLAGGDKQLGRRMVTRTARVRI